MHLILKLFMLLLAVVDQKKALGNNPLVAKVVLSTPEGEPIETTLGELGFHVPLTVVNVTTADGRTFTLDLHLNRMLLSADYREKVCTDKGDYYLTFNATSDFCFYVGTVRGFPGSVAALSTCGQIRGFFVANGTTYSITPLKGGRLRQAVVEKEENTNFTCGVLNSLRTFVHRWNKRSIDSKVDRKTRFIELYAVSDTTHFNQFANPSEVTQRIKEVANGANALYNSVDMYLVLVGTEVWQTPKIIVNASDYSETLKNFYDYKKRYLNPNSPSHDNACLFLNVTFTERVLGLAQLDSMCDSIESGNFIVDKKREDTRVASSAVLLTHEIGHNMGLIHDNLLNNCPCDDVTGVCIMNSAVNVWNPPSMFSSCSKSYLIDKRSLGLDLCLFNIPDLMNLTGGVSTCGNGIIEQGEDCDCGGLPADICSKSCCGSNCKLIGGASCAMGMCCELKTCTFTMANTICRSAEDSCDIPELCDGRSAFCPTDSYKHDGLSCTVAGKPAYCYKGGCKNRESQCQMVWGSSATASPDSCYSSNIMGTEYGGCEIIFGNVTTILPCAIKDVLCGLLFCEVSVFETKLRSMKYQYHTDYSGLVCASALLNFGTQIENPGLAPDGAECGTSKMCLDQKCIDVASVVSANSCPSVCQDGVCDNSGQCRCQNGLLYPNCNGETFTKLVLTTMKTILPSSVQILVCPEKMTLLFISYSALRFFVGNH